MPRNRSIVEIDTARLNRIIRNIPGNTHDAIRGVAFSIERKAKIKAPVDTGALRASIYTRVGRTGDNFSEMASEVRSRRPEAEIAPLPEPENNTTAYIGPSVEYAAAVEYGTHNRSGRPYLTPAVREVEADLVREFGRVATDE